MDTHLIKFIEDKAEVDKLIYAMYLRSENKAASSFAQTNPVEADGVPILARRKISQSDANIRISHDLFGLIAKEKAGYFASNIQRSYTDDIPEKVREKYQVFDRTNRFDKRMKSLAVDCARWGVGYSLCYLYEGKVHFSQLNAWQAAVHYNDKSGEPEYGFVYDMQAKGANGKAVKVWVYDAQNVSTYMGSTLQNAKLIETSPHGFGAVPVIEWRNDENMIGNAERAISLIDAYDLMVSDNATEQAAFRNAYLLLSNMGMIDEETKTEMKKTGVLVADTENAKAEFITKNINPEFAKLVMDTLWENIFVVSATVDTKALATLANATAFQIGQIYRGMENDCKTTELEWRDSLETLDRLLKSYWTVLDTPTAEDYNTYDVNYVFNRNKPKDTLSDLEALKRAGGVLPNSEILRRALNLTETEAEELAEAALAEFADVMPNA